MRVGQTYYMYIWLAVYIRQRRTHLDVTSEVGSLPAAAALGFRLQRQQPCQASACAVQWFAPRGGAWLPQQQLQPQQQQQLQPQPLLTAAATAAAAAAAGDASVQRGWAGRLRMEQRYHVRAEKQNRHLM